MEPSGTSERSSASSASRPAKTPLNIGVLGTVGGRGLPARIVGTGLWRATAGLLIVGAVGSIAFVTFVIVVGGGNDSLPLAAETPSPSPDIDSTPTPVSPTTIPPTATPSFPTPPLSPAPVPATTIRIIAVDGSGERSLPVAASARFYWSPDGQTIAEMSTDHGVTFVDVASGSREQVFARPAVTAAWAPDSSGMAVYDYSVSGEEADDITIINRLGQVRARLEREGRLPIHASAFDWAPGGGPFAANFYGEDIILLPNESRLDIKGSFYGFVWASESELVAVEAPSETDPATLVRIDATSGKRLQETPLDVPYNQVAIAPGGEWALAWTYRGEFDYDVRIVDMEDGSELSVNVDPGTIGGFAFSRSGDTVLANVDVCTNDQELVVLDRSGDIRVLVQGIDLVARFSPDGDQVAYSTDFELYVVPSDGSEPPKQIAANINGPGGWAWSPDSRQIAAAPPPQGGFSACS